MKGGKRMKKKLFALMIATAVLLAGCALDGDGMENTGSSGKNKNGGSRSEVYDVEVHTPEEIVKANEEFLSKISVECIGSFDVKPVKFGEDNTDLWLEVENKHSFPASAYLTFEMKNEAGDVISAGDSRTRVLTKGSKDLLQAQLGDYSNKDFSELVITAYLRESAGEGIYEQIDPSTYTEVANEATGAGRRIDLEVGQPHGIVTHDFALFFDSDDNPYRVRSFSSGGDNGELAYIFPEYDYARYELYAWAYTGETAEPLSDDVYSAYESAVPQNYTGTDYMSLDGYIRYSFVESADGKTLLRCRNITDATRAFRNDEFIILGGPEDYESNTEGREYFWNPDETREEASWRSLSEPEGKVWQIVVGPGKDLVWDVGLPAGARFIMLPFAANVCEYEEPVPEAELTKEGNVFRLTADWSDADYEHFLEGAFFVVYTKDGEIVATERFGVDEDENGYDGHTAEFVTSYTGDYDSADLYMQYRYKFIATAMP